MGLMVLLQYNQHLPVTIALYARIETPSYQADYIHDEEKFKQFMKLC